MTDAVEAARRIIAKERQNKEYPPSWMHDAACVSHALIASVEQEKRYREALKHVADRVRGSDDTLRSDIDRIARTVLASEQ